MSALNEEFTLEIAGERVEFRPLKARKLLGLLKRVAELGGAAAKAAGPTKKPADGDGAAAVTLELGGIVQLIADGEDLAVELLTGSTGKDVAWIDELELEDFLGAIEAALKANLGAVQKKMRAMKGGFLTGLLPGKTPKTDAPQQSPTS